MDVKVENKYGGERITLRFLPRVKRYRKHSSEIFFSHPDILEPYMEAFVLFTSNLYRTIAMTFLLFDNEEIQSQDS